MAKKKTPELKLVKPPSEGAVAALLNIVEEEEREVHARRLAYIETLTTREKEELIIQHEDAIHLFKRQLNKERAQAQRLRERLAAGDAPRDPSMGWLLTRLLIRVIEQGFSLFLRRAFKLPTRK